MFAINFGGRAGGQDSLPGAVSDAEGKLKKAQDLVGEWQQPSFRQSVRRNVPCLLSRMFSFRVDTIGPLTKALEAVREAIKSRDILQNSPGRSPEATVFLQDTAIEFNRLTGLVARDLDIKLSPAEQGKWTAFPICQFLRRTQESVTNRATADELIDEGKKWTSIPRPPVVPFSLAERAKNAMLMRDAKWSVYGEIARNMTFAALAVAGVVAAGIYLKDKPLQLELPALW